ncbi:TOBE domain-containing protein [Persephonella sp.]
MNKIKGTVFSIKSSGNISLVEADTPVGKLCSVVLESADSLRYTIGSKVYLLFKETEVSIGKNLQGQISMRNQIHCQIKEIEKGEILSRVTLSCGKIEIISVITTASAEKMELAEGDKVLALIKTNEVSIMESIDD